MKRRGVWLAVCIAGVLAIVSAAYLTRDSVMIRYGQAVEGQAYRTITEQEAQALAEETSIVWIDVREAPELEAGMIAGALHWPLSDFDAAVQAADLEQDAVVLLYCGSGVRSEKAARKLVKLGYRHVFDFGSIQNWCGELG